MKRAAYVILAGILGICLLPVLSALVAITIADMAGCALNEGSVNPCQIMGGDWGDVLYFGMMMAWLGLATLPFAALAALGLAVLGLYDLLRRLFARD